jgi:prevent-host-death family protein
MAEIVDLQDAKAHFSALVQRAHAGQEIILTKHGKPYARLVPLEPRPRRLGFMPGRVDHSFFEPLPQDEIEAWSG